MTTVPDCVVECGGRSDGNTPINDLTSRSVRSICVESIMKIRCLHLANYQCERNCRFPGLTDWQLGSNFNSVVILPLPGVTYILLTLLGPVSQ
jgi:hypothetical protein